MLTSPVVEAPLGGCRITHGPNDSYFPTLVGKSVAAVRRSLASVFNIPDEAEGHVAGVVVPPAYRLRAGDSLAFLRRRGLKGVGRVVWTGEQFCQFFGVTPEDLAAWLAQGLKAGRCLDGSLRITETAADEFFRGERITSPYLDIDQAAAYLGKTKKAMYALIERGKLKKLPGSHLIRFTRDQLDNYLKGN